MVRGVVLALAATAVLGASCNHDPLPTVYPDGGPDGASMPDLAQAVCRTHQILSVPLDDIQAVFDGAYRDGSSLQLRISYSLRDACDVPGDVSVRVMPGNATDFVVITARTWRGDRDCGQPTATSRVVTLGPVDGLGNQNLLVSDGAPGGTRMIHLQRSASGMSACAPTTGLCGADCECAASNKNSRCLMGGALFECGVPCSDDVDCPDTMSGVAVCGAVSGAFCYQCERGFGRCPCEAGHSCPFGQTCKGKCVPLEALPPPRCSCDEDCGTGRLCAHDGTCVIPCTNSAGCPAGAPTCDGGRCK